jgi:hypothetical protein
MVYASPTLNYMADIPLVNLQRLQNRVLYAIGNIDRCTSVYNLQVAFKIPYMYGYIIKLCNKLAEVIQNHLNPNVHGTGQGEAVHRKYKKLKLGSGHACDHLGV